MVDPHCVPSDILARIYMIVYRPFLLGFMTICLLRSVPISASSSKSQYGRILFEFGKCIEGIGCNPNGHCSCQDFNVNMAIIDCFMPIETFKSAEWRPRSISRLDHNFKQLSAQFRERMRELCSNDGYYPSYVLRNYGVDVQALSAKFVSEVLNKVDE